MTERKKSPFRDPNSSISSPSVGNQVIVSSRHPHARSPGNFDSPSSRRRSTLSGQSSIRKEPGLQYLLAAENQAAEMIALARIKRNELIRQANHESQIELEAFRQQRETQYQHKLQEANQLDQYRSKLDETKLHSLDKMENNVKREQPLLVNQIVHYVIDDIPVQSHPNLQHAIFLQRTTYF